jgi:hypothetical protein
MDYSDTQIPVENADTQFTAIGGKKEITIDFSDTYTLKSDRDWCKTTVNGKTVILDVEPNRTLSGRTALLTLQADEKRSYITVTQTSAIIKLENYTYDVYTQRDTVHVQYQCDFPVSVAPQPEWISSSVNHEKKEITFYIEEEENYPRTATVQLYVDGGNNTVLTIKEILIRQNFLHYDDFIGPYTMTYSKSLSISPDASLDVSLEAGVRGRTYYLKGLLADDGIGNITVYYDETTGSLFFPGCRIVTAKDSDSPDFWWAPYQIRGTSAYVTPTNAYGMKSVDHSIAGRLSFAFDDDGLDPGYITVGFVLRKYIGSTNNGNVAGKDNQSMYFFPAFKRK